MDLVEGICNLCGTANRRVFQRTPTKNYTQLLIDTLCPEYLKLAEFQKCSSKVKICPLCAIIIKRSHQKKKEIELKKTSKEDDTCFSCSSQEQLVRIHFSWKYFEDILGLLPTNHQYHWYILCLDCLSYLDGLYKIKTKLIEYFPHLITNNFDNKIIDSESQDDKEKKTRVKRSIVNSILKNGSKEEKQLPSIPRDILYRLTSLSNNREYKHLNKNCNDERIFKHIPYVSLRRMNLENANLTKEDELMNSTGSKRKSAFKRTSSSTSEMDSPPKKKSKKRVSFQLDLISIIPSLEEMNPAYRVSETYSDTQHQEGNSSTEENTLVINDESKSTEPDDSVDTTKSEDMNITCQHNSSESNPKTEVEEKSHFHQRKKRKLLDQEESIVNKHGKSGTITQVDSAKSPFTFKIKLRNENKQKKPKLKNNKLRIHKHTEDDTSFSKNVVVHLERIDLSPYSKSKSTETFMDQSITLKKSSKPKSIRRSKDDEDSSEKNDEVESSQELRLPKATSSSLDMNDVISSSDTICLGFVEQPTTDKDKTVEADSTPSNSTNDVLELDPRLKESNTDIDEHSTRSNQEPNISESTRALSKNQNVETGRVSEENTVTESESNVIADSTDYILRLDISVDSNEDEEPELLKGFVSNSEICSTTDSTCNLDIINNHTESEETEITDSEDTIITTKNVDCAKESPKGNDVTSSIDITLEDTEDACSETEHDLQNEIENCDSQQEHSEKNEQGENVEENEQENDVEESEKEKNIEENEQDNNLEKNEQDNNLEENEQDINIKEIEQEEKEQDNSLERNEQDNNLGENEQDKNIKEIEQEEKEQDNSLEKNDQDNNLEEHEQDKNIKHIELEDSEQDENMKGRKQDGDLEENEQDENIEESEQGGNSENADPNDNLEEKQQENDLKESDQEKNTEDDGKEKSPEESNHSESPEDDENINYDLEDLTVLDECDEHNCNSADELETEFTEGLSVATIAEIESEGGHHQETKLDDNINSDEPDSINSDEPSKMIDEGYPLLEELIGLSEEIENLTEEVT